MLGAIRTFAMSFAFSTKVRKYSSEESNEKSEDFFSPTWRFEVFHVTIRFRTPLLTLRSSGDIVPPIRFFVPLRQMSRRKLRLMRASARLRCGLSSAEQYSDALVWEMQHTLLGLIGFDSVL